VLHGVAVGPLRPVGRHKPFRQVLRVDVLVVRAERLATNGVGDVVCGLPARCQRRTVTLDSLYGRRTVPKVAAGGRHLRVAVISPAAHTTHESSPPGGTSAAPRTQHPPPAPPPAPAAGSPRRARSCRASARSLRRLARRPTSSASTGAACRGNPARWCPRPGRPKPACRLGAGGGRWRRRKSVA